MLQDKEIERRLKISKALKGRPPWNKGLKNWRITSAETRRKISLALKGRTYVVSPETRRKISATMKGRKPPNLEFLHALPRTSEWRENISKGNKGKIVTEETRRKISEAKRDPIRPLYRAIRECYKSREWRKAVFRRDNYTCVVCKNRGGVLNADHFPRRFVDILRDSNITTIERALDLNDLWNVENGRTLCFECHTQTETWGNKHKVIK